MSSREDSQREPGPRRRRGRGRAVGKYAGAALLAGWVLAPLYLITLSAFSTTEEVYAYPRSLVPHVSLGTMSFFVSSAGVLPALRNSVLVALITTGLTMALACPAGYALARYAFRGRNAYRLTILSTRAFPVVILSIPLAVLFLQWNVYDTIWAVALMHTALALPFVVLIVSTVFVGVPVELEEAAQIFGCSRARAVVKVVLPLAVPGLAAAATFTVLLSYNEVFAASILTLQNTTLPALVLNALTQSPLPFRYAAAWFLLAPAFVFILLVRRYLLGFGGRAQL
jgi:multiple sugar transport system permease protein